MLEALDLCGKTLVLVFTAALQRPERLLSTLTAILLPALVAVEVLREIAPEAQYATAAIQSTEQEEGEDRATLEDQLPETVVRAPMLSLHRTLLEAMLEQIALDSNFTEAQAETAAPQEFMTVELAENPAEVEAVEI